MSSDRGLALERLPEVITFGDHGAHRHDHRDLTIEMLAADEAALLDRVIATERERDSFRVLAHEAIHALHDVAADRDRQRAAHHRVLKEYRALRAQMMGKPI